MRVGRAELRPPTCEIVGPGGREEVQPKVMQVLVALAEARGDTVTRDDLIRQCWDGRIVGEDSINRVIVKIRKLGEGLGGGSFAVKTVPRVGYRLVEAVGDGRWEPNKLFIASPKPTRRWLSPRRLTAAALLALTGATAATFSRNPDSPASGPPPRPNSFYEVTARDLAMRGAAAAFESTPAQHAQAIAYFRRAIEQTPDEPTLWGSLAMNYYFHSASSPPERQDAALLRARRAALRSLELNPREGHALAALMAVHPNFSNWAAKEAGFRRALARMDGNSPAPLYQYARFLASAGRNAEALTAIERAYAKHPLVPWIAIERISQLAAAGRIEEAERAATRAAELWPRNEDLWSTRFFLLALNGEPEAALRLVDDSSAWPGAARPSDMALMRRTATAIAGSSEGEREALLAEWSQLAAEGQSYAEHAIRLAAFWRCDDIALTLAETLLGERAPTVTKRFADHDEFALRGDRPTAALFAGATERLWAHQGFMPLMERIGLVDFWRRSKPPDLCLDPHLRQTCERNGLNRERG
jgi:DNA-binding winged helix-turn-helix (wHTH) protein/tetratricopeptide (TPR) repeat protein